MLGVDVASYATGGTGTSLDPWTGWDTAITWAARTRYLFRSGWFAVATSPNYLYEGIEIIGSPGAYIRHTGTGNAFTMDAGATEGGLWVQNVRVENITVYGNPTALTGTLAVTNGATAVVGTGTSFMTQVAVGDSVTWASGISADSYIVSVVTDDTHLTLNRVSTLTYNTTAKVTKSQNGFYLRGVRNGVFDRLSVKDVAAAAIRTEACVTNSLRMFRCTYHEPTQSTGFNCRPQYGIVVAGRGFDWSTCWTIEEPVIEGMQAVGIWLKSDSYGNTIINGTSEGNPAPCVGLRVDSNRNWITGIDLEANIGDDLIVQGAFNTFENLTNDGTCILSVADTPYGSHNTFIRGNYQDFTIQTNAELNQLLGCGINGTFTDNGVRTIKIGVGNTDYRTYFGIPLPATTVPSGGSAYTPDGKRDGFVTLIVSADIAINAPTNPASNQEITLRITATGSTRTLTWNAAWMSLTGTPLPTSIATTTTTIVKAVYNPSTGKWEAFVNATA